MPCDTSESDNEAFLGSWGHVWSKGHWRTLVRLGNENDPDGLWDKRGSSLKVWVTDSSSSGLPEWKCFAEQTHTAIRFLLLTTRRMVSGLISISVLLWGLFEVVVSLRLSITETGMRQGDETEGRIRTTEPPAATKPQRPPLFRQETKTLWVSVCLCAVSWLALPPSHRQTDRQTGPTLSGNKPPYVRQGKHSGSTRLSLKTETCVIRITLKMLETLQQWEWTCFSREHKVTPIRLNSVLSSVDVSHHILSAVVLWNHTFLCPAPLFVSAGLSVKSPVDASQRQAWKPQLFRGRRSGWSCRNSPSLMWEWKSIKISCLLCESSWTDASAGCWTINPSVSGKPTMPPEPQLQVQCGSWCQCLSF